MRIERVDPREVEPDPMNEREEVGDVEELAESASQTGVVQPPVVREQDGQLTVTVGRRRVEAAKEAGLEEITVLVADWTDEEALKASISENIDAFRSQVPAEHRARAIQRLWEMLGGEGVPSYAHVGSELGVPRQTLRRWHEPYHEQWTGTAVDPETDEPFDHDVLGEEVLSEVRRMTGGGDEGERIANEVAERGLTQPQVQQARKLVDEGAEVDTAIEQVHADEEDDTEEDVEWGEITIEFEDETTEAASRYVEERGTDLSGLVQSSVRYFLEAEGYL